MSTIVRRKRTSRSEIGPYRRHELLTGKIVYPVEEYTGYGDGSGTDLAAFVSDEMRADWQANRAALLAFWATGKETLEYFPVADVLPWLFPCCGSPDTLPWASKQFDEGK
jgi:hypothetical protein